MSKAHKSPQTGKLTEAINCVCTRGKQKNDASRLLFVDATNRAFSRIQQYIVACQQEKAHMLCTGSYRLERLFFIAKYGQLAVGMGSKWRAVPVAWKVYGSSKKSRFQKSHHSLV